MTHESSTFLESFKNTRHLLWLSSRGSSSRDLWRAQMFLYAWYLRPGKQNICHIFLNTHVVFAKLTSSRTDCFFESMYMCVCRGKRGTITDVHHTKLYDTQVAFGKDKELPRPKIEDKFSNAYLYALFLLRVSVTQPFEGSRGWSYLVRWKFHLLQEHTNKAMKVKNWMNCSQVLHAH